MTLTVTPITSHVGIFTGWHWQVTQDGRVVRRCLTREDAERDRLDLLARKPLQRRDPSDDGRLF